MAERCNLCYIILLVSSLSMAVDAAALVPAVFIFGDSTVDVGTNTHSNLTYFKATSPPNGIDYPGSRPTGRFSNGYNTADFLSILMGFRRSPPPFLSLVDNSTLHLRKHIIYGANFASGGSGIIADTGKLMGSRIPFGEQIQQFVTVRKNLTVRLGLEAADSLLSKSIFLFSTGSNDIFQYFVIHKKSNQLEFIATLVKAYENHLRIIYALGARKFGIVSVPPIGCCPAQRMFNDTGCLEDLNEYSRMFYSTIEHMLLQLSYELKEMKYSLGNSYEMVIDIMNNPSKYKFKEVESACCGRGKLNGSSPCSKVSLLCWNRDEYLFWDWLHPTQAASKLAARTLYDGEPKYVTPISFKQLAEEDS